MTDLPTPDDSAPTPVVVADSPAPVVVADSPAVAQPDSPDTPTTQDVQPVSGPVAVTQAIVQSVVAHPGIPQEHKADVALAVITGLSKVAPEIFELTHVGGEVQGIATVGLQLAGLILESFIHLAA